MNGIESTITTTTTIRILRSQAAALKQFSATSGASASALMRVLLQEYFEGRIPQAAVLLQAEKVRSEIALKSEQFGATKVA